MEQKSMTDHDDNPDQDCYKDANLYAGKLTDMANKLSQTRDEEGMRVMLLLIQEKYNKLFDAFMAGVRCARVKWKEEWDRETNRYNRK